MTDLRRLRKKKGFCCLRFRAKKTRSFVGSKWWLSRSFLLLLLLRHRKLRSPIQPSSFFFLLKKRFSLLCQKMPYLARAPFRLFTYDWCYKKKKYLLLIKHILRIFDNQLQYNLVQDIAIRLPYNKWRILLYSISIDIYHLFLRSVEDKMKPEVNDSLISK